MSLLFRQRAIARAVSGELSPGAEARLHAHLRRCSVCRARYDELAFVKTSLDGGRLAASRARARLTAALDEVSTVSEEAGEVNAKTGGRIVAHRRPALFLIATLVPAALAPAAALLLWLTRPDAPPPKPAEDVTLRGEAERPSPQPQGSGSSAAAGPLAVAKLVLYASRKTAPIERSPHGPLRLLGELPGSGEARVSLADYLQLGVRGLATAAHVRVAAVDERGGVHELLPDTAAGPTGGTSALGPSLDLAGRLEPGRVRLIALFSATPIGDQALEAALAGQQRADVATGVLVIAP